MAKGILIFGNIGIFLKNFFPSKKKKEIHSQPVYNKNYLKTKINSHGNEVTDFYVKNS